MKVCTKIAGSQNEPSREKRKCKTCGKECSTNDNLKKHSKVHLKKDNVSCSLPQLRMKQERQKTDNVPNTIVQRL